MRKIISHLRRRPVHVRHNIAVFGSLVLTFLIAAGWLMSLHSKPAQNQASLKDELKPFTILKNGLVEQFREISKGVNSVTSTVKNQATAVQSQTPPQDNSVVAPTESGPLEQPTPDPDPNPPTPEGEGSYVVNPQ